MPYTKTQTQAIHHYIINWIEHYRQLQRDAANNLITLTPDMDQEITTKIELLSKMYTGLPYSGEPNARDIGPVTITNIPNHHQDDL